MGVLAYILQLRLRLDLTRCATASQAALADCELTILVLDNREEGAGLQKLCEQLKGSSLVYDPQSLSSEAECSATAYLGGQLEPARILDRVSALLVRRRGVKPRSSERCASKAVAPVLV